MNAMMNANYADGSWTPYMHGPVSLIVLILVVIATFWIASRLLHGRSICPHGNGSALDTLGQRFANGEIDEEEFKAKKKILTSK